MEKQGTYGRVSYASCCDDKWGSQHQMSGVINTRVKWSEEQQLAFLQKPGHELGKGRFLFQVYNKKRKMVGGVS